MSSAFFFLVRSFFFVLTLDFFGSLSFGTTTTSTHGPLFLSISLLETDTITRSMADTSSTNGATIELTLQNLSLTVIPYPSLLTRTFRQLKHTRNPAHNLAPGAPTFSKTLDEEPTSPSSIERDGNSGISIFRGVDLTLKPGQGMISHAGLLRSIQPTHPTDFLCTL